MKKILFVFLVLFCLGCESAALQHAKARYPQCKVEVVEEVSNRIEVIVKCPYEDPFHKTYRTNQ